MGIWVYYFLAKLLMYFGGFIGLHVAENLAFAVLVALPLRHRLLRIGRQLLAVPLAIGLLYHDSWLPPWRRIVAQSDQVSHFSLTYFVELAQRFINLQLLLGLLLLTAVCWLLSRRLRLSTFAFLGIAFAPLLSSAPALWSTLAGRPTPEASATAVAGGRPSAARASKQELDAAMQQFYQDEQKRRLNFLPAADDGLPYDILLLQICSLAWDDMDAVGQRRHPLLDRFDLRFDNFNSAASYSGPAAIRLLRSGCGQQRHEALYQPADPACYLMAQLQASGFQMQWAMDHDGVFGPLNRDIEERGNVDVAQFPLNGFTPALKAFEGSSYFDDYEILSAWWKHRLQLPAPRVALYYNTGYLHDGNIFLDGSKPGAIDSYRRRLLKQFDGISRLMDEIKASGRRAVVVLVPEHGANVRGDRMQISGLREIPSPAIGLIPVGIKLVGRDSNEPLVQLEQPSGHFALGSVLAGFLAANPFMQGAPTMSDYVRNLPQTEYLAENDGTVVMRYRGAYYMRTADGDWQPYATAR